MLNQRKIKIDELTLQQHRCRSKVKRNKESDGNNNQLTFSIMLSISHIFASFLFPLHEESLFQHRKISVLRTLAVLQFFFIMISIVNISFFHILHNKINLFEYYLHYYCLCDAIMASKIKSWHRDFAYHMKYFVHRFKMM